MAYETLTQDCYTLIWPGAEFQSASCFGGALPGLCSCWATLFEAEQEWTMLQKVGSSVRIGATLFIAGPAGLLVGPMGRLRT